MTKRFSDKQLLFGGSVVLAVGLAGWALSSRVWLLMLVLIPVSVAGGTVNVVGNSALTKSVVLEETGGILGLSAALGSLARVVSPILGGALIDTLGAAAPGIFGALVLVWQAWYTWRRILSVPDQPCPHQSVEYTSSGIDRHISQESTI